VSIVRELASVGGRDSTSLQGDDDCRVSHEGQKPEKVALDGTVTLGTGAGGSAV